MNAKSQSRVHSFTLILTGVTELTDAVVDAIYEAGCDDATISKRMGTVYLSFDRAAASMKDAIVSAIKDVRSAGIGADVLRVDTSELVSQAEIARRIHKTRQLVNQFISGTRGSGNFPSPACYVSDGSPLWQWSHVAGWLHKGKLIKKHELSDAEELAAVNAVLDLQVQKSRNPNLVETLVKAVSHTPRKRVRSK